MARAYYNEIDPFAAAWLRELIKHNEIAPGDVDERSILDVRPSDLNGYTQCHFFAGIGVWSYALRLAGWGDDRPVWTGSCPCQPFSSAGKGGGFADERHLWPYWHWLISECRPAIVFGEQSANAIPHRWYDLVTHDLEASEYAVGAAVIPASAVGGPHRRERLWFVAHPEREGLPSRLLEHDYTAAVELAAHGRGRFGYPIGKAWNGEPTLALLVHGSAAEMAATVAFGNAIVPQAAQAWIETVMETMTIPKEPPCP